jgi:hypothetical protein
MYVNHKALFLRSPHKSHALIKHKSAEKYPDAFAFY